MNKYDKTNLITKHWFLIDVFSSTIRMLLVLMMGGKVDGIDSEK